MKSNQKVLLFNAIFLLSLLLSLVSLKLYQKTIIPIKIIGIFYGMAVLIFILFRNKFMRISPWNNFVNFIFIVFVAGSLLILSFLGINYCFAEKQTEDRIYEITRKTEIIGRRYNRGQVTPAVFVEVNQNRTKRFDFDSADKKAVDKADSLKLSLSKGLLHYYIIRDRALR